MTGEGTRAVCGRRGSELDEVGLILLIAGSNETVDLKSQSTSRCVRQGAGETYFAFQPDLLLIRVWCVPFRETSLALPVLDEDEGKNHGRDLEG